MCLGSESGVVDAAREMRDHDIGNVLVTDGDRVRGIVTDRDLVVRVVAEGRDPGTASLATFCTDDVTTVGPDDTVSDVVKIMAEQAIRRVPVVDNGKPVGIVSIGDLAEEQDRQSVLAAISSASPDT